MKHRHFKLPWHYENGNIVDANGNIVADFVPYVGNAELIVVSANSHAALIKAIKEALAFLVPALDGALEDYQDYDVDGMVESLKAALALAEEATNGND